MLTSAPAYAQDGPPPSRLEELIPDSAVANPEGWAEQEEVAVTPVTQRKQADALPQAEDGQGDDQWPDPAGIPQPDPIAEEGDIEFVTFEDDPQFTLEDGEEERISRELLLVFPAEESAFPQREAFVERFESLSNIDELDDAGSPARLAAQARADEKLLERLLRNFGYYDAQVLRSHGGASAEGERDPDEPGVRFDILPGAQYHIGAVKLGMLDATHAAFPAQDGPRLRETFEIHAGDPIDSDRIVLERVDLATALGENGYPFATIQQPDLLIDHARQEGDLDMPVTMGGKYEFGAITSNMPDFLSSDHLAEIARFKPGETYQRSLQTDLRRAILATGLVSSVDLTPLEAAPPANGEPGEVDIAVEMTKARLRTIAGGVGYGTGEGFKAQASWEHRNLFPSEGMLRLRGLAGTREQLLGVTFRKNNFRGRDRILTIDTYGSTVDYDAYDARTLSLVGRYERVSNLLFQKPFSWSFGAEATASQEADRDDTGVLGPRSTFLIAALPTHAQLDTSDDLLDPTKGFRLRGAVSPEISIRDSHSSTYLKVQFDLSNYQKVSDGFVLAARARAASITGADILNIAPSRRLYAGGGGSVRGYGYQAIGPRDGNGAPNGGRSLVEFSAELRIRTGLLDGALGLVPFVDAGAVNLDATPGFSGMRFGAGLGLRYFTDFGPIRVDVGVPLNPGPGDGPVGVQVALGQAF